VFSFHFAYKTCAVFKFEFESKEFEFNKGFVEKKENTFLSFLRPWAETLFCFACGPLAAQHVACTGHGSLGSLPGVNQLTPSPTR
jgi:hypothetical protein